MPKLTKKIDIVINLPEKWLQTWNPLNDKGKPIFDDLPEHEVGPGRVKIFSLSQEEKSKIQQKCFKMVIVDGKAFPMLDTVTANEETFVARLGGQKGFWEDFFGPDGQPLNCTEDNQRHFAHNEGLRIFVHHHVGDMLDKMAEGKASDEEKNFLTSLGGQPAGGNGSITTVASAAKK